MAGRFWALGSLVCVTAGLLAAHGCQGKQRDFVPLGESNAEDGVPEQEMGLLQPASGGAGGVAGTAALGPQLVVEPLALALGAVVVDLAAVRTVTVSNLGDQVLDIPTVSLAAGSAAPFSILQNRCEDRLEPGESCSVSLQFLPTTLGDFSASVIISSLLGGEASVALTGIGLPLGEMLITTAEGSSAQFGSVRIGESLEATFALINPSTTPSGPLQIGLNNPDFALPVPIDGECIPGTTSLVNGEACNIRVSFTPTQREPSEAVLTVQSEGVGSSGLKLDGIGSAPGLLVASESPLNLQAVFGQAAQATLNIENQGDEPVTLIGATIAAGDPEGDFVLLQSSCSGVLQGGASCQISLEFKPQALGARSASLVVTPELGTPLSVELAGVSLKPGTLALAPLEGPAPAEGQPVDFGPVRRDTERVLIFRVTNPGGESSGFLEQISAGGDFTALAPSQPGECAATTTLINGESCDVPVRFKPSLRGPRDATLTIVSVGTGSVALPLKGTGTLAADLSSTPTSIPFGNAVLGETRSAVVTVTNEGDEAASPPQVDIVGTGADAFSVGGCSQALEFGATCALTVTFHPTGDPQHTGLLSPTLQIVSAAGGSANVSLTARGLRPGSIDIAPNPGGSTTFQAAVNTSQTQVFSITNTGGVDSGALSISVTNPPGPRNFELTGSGLTTACQVGQRLPAGNACTVGVTFRTALPGTSFGATLSVSSSGAGSDSLALSGVAQAPATLTSPDAVANFASGAASPEFSWRINNTGDVATPPLSIINSSTANFSLGATGNCPLNQAVGLPAHASCIVSVRFAPQAQAVQGQDQVVPGSLTLNAGGLRLNLSLTGTIPRALAGRGQTCTRDSDCQAGTFSFCGNSGSSTLPNVCCNSPCAGNSCQGCNAGATGGSCVARAPNAACTTSGSSRAGLCFQAGACTEFCVLDESVMDECLLQ